jgi:salicylate hydroxylase
MLRETGALISLQPNASKIITSWDLDKFLAATEPLHDRCFRMINTAGEVVREIGLDPATFGADRTIYHRQDLHSALRQAAESSDLPGQAVQVRTAAAVVSCNPETGSVTLENGETVTADLVVGADGIHSVIRTAVLGAQHDAVPTGTSAYRMLMPIEALNGIEVPPSVFVPGDAATTMIVGHDKRVIMGPGRGGKVFGIVALVPDEKMHEESSTTSWVAEGSKVKLQETFKDFPPWLGSIFEKAPDVALWQLRDIDPLSTWVNGRVIIIGDAAHSMLPTQGQGASQSVEDAEALQAFLAPIQHKPSKDEISKALTEVFDARYERASVIQGCSREQAKPGTWKNSKEVKLDPAQFMTYNCDYSGAKDWISRQESTVKVC